ncbi:hypothetical protein BC832DRAFT_543787 [Gaertneriomyces semiglobifer]|nr:hypothetical protein BC832DRAFT_543787 [Gaertneriomyces semiglobifer]
MMGTTANEEWPNGAVSPPTSFLDGDAYKVEQNDDILTVTIPLLPTESADEVDLGLQDQSALVRIGSRTVLEGHFFQPINAAESSHTVQNHILSITLKKVPDLFGSSVTFPVLFSSGRIVGAPIPKDAPLDDLDPHSLYLLASWLLGRLRNATRALPYFASASSRGSIPASLKLGAWYTIGKEAHPEIPVERDLKKALEYHERAAQAGSAEACFLVADQLAPIATNADDIQPSYEATEQAIHYLARIPALLAHFGQSEHPLLAMAHHRMAVLHSNLHSAGYLDHLASALEHFKAAHELRHPQSTWSLGLHYLHGFGIHQDAAKAVDLFREAKMSDSGLAYPPPLDLLNEDQITQLIEMEREVRNATGIAAENSVDVQSMVRKVLTGEGIFAGEDVPAALSDLNYAERPVSGEGITRAKATKRRRRRSDTMDASSMQIVLAGVAIVGAVGIATMMWMRRR